MNKLLNSKSKSYSRPSKKRVQKRNSINIDEKSKNQIISKSPDKMKYSNSYQENNTPKAFNNTKYKVGPDYKNNFFSLRLIKINNKTDDNNKKDDNKSNKRIIKLEKINENNENDQFLLVLIKNIQMKEII